MKNPYIANSDEFDRWEEENKIYEERQKRMQDMREYITEKILSVVKIELKKEVESISELGFDGSIIKTTLLKELEPVYVVDVSLHYKQQSNAVILKIGYKNFENWRKKRKSKDKEEYDCNNRIRRTIEVDVSASNKEVINELEKEIEDFNGRVFNKGKIRIMSTRWARFD